MSDSLKRALLDEIVENNNRLELLWHDDPNRNPEDNLSSVSVNLNRIRRSDDNVK